MTDPQERTTVWTDDYQMTGEVLDYTPVVQHYAARPKPVSYRDKVKFVEGFGRHGSTWAVDIKATHFKFPREYADNMPSEAWEAAMAIFWESDWEYLNDGDEGFKERFPEYVLYTEGRGGGWLELHRTNGKYVGSPISVDADEDSDRYARKWKAANFWDELERRIKHLCHFKRFGGTILKIADDMQAEFGIKLSDDMRANPNRFTYYMGGMIAGGEIGWIPTRGAFVPKFEWIFNGRFFAENVLVSDIRKAAVKYGEQFLLADRAAQAYEKKLMQRWGKKYRAEEPHAAYSWEDSQLNDMVDVLHALETLRYDMAVAYAYQVFEQYCTYKAGIPMADMKERNLAENADPTCLFCQATQTVRCRTCGHCMECCECGDFV